MNSTSHKKKTIVMGVCLLIVLFSVLTVFNIGDLQVDKKGRIIEINTGWKIRTNYETIEDATLSETKFKSLKKGDCVVFSRNLPEEEVNNPVLRIFTDHSSVEVFIDGELIYEYGLERTLNNKFIGYGYHHIPLPYDYQGRNISIRMISSENLNSSSLRAPEICDSTTMIRDYAANNRWLLASSFFLMMAGMGLFLLSGFSLIKNGSGFRLMAVGAFSYCLSIWSLCNYNLTEIFTDNLLVKNYLEYTSLYLIPLFFLLYFWGDLKNRDTQSIRVIYKSLLVMQALFLIAISITHWTDALHLSAAMWGQLVLIGIEAVGILAVCIHDIYAKSFSSESILIGVVLISFLALLDLGLFAVQKIGIETNDSHFSSFTSLGAMIFVVCLVTDIYQQNETKLAEGYRMETLQKLAYEDALTGIPNRRRYDDIAIDCQDAGDDYAIIVMDINDLKQVNDKYGHERGDLLIASMAECLKKTFGKGTMIARTGGDEFAAIVMDLKIWDPESLLWRLQAEIDIKNTANPDLNLSAAFGYCKRDEFPDKTAKEIYRIADDRMYEKKAQMKKGGSPL